MKKLIIMALSAAIIFVTSIPASAQNTISGAGSSYINNLMQNCKDGSVNVNYLPAGSGAGKSQFVSKTIDFGATDAPYTSTDIKPNFEFGYIPLVGGPIAIAYNIKGIKSLRLTNKIISDIYLGKIVNWNDKAIAAINSGTKLPSIKIVPTYRADASGTSANFTTYLASTVSGAGWKKDSTSFSSANKSVKGIPATKSIGISNFVKQTNGAIGYLDLGDAQSLSIAYLKNESGEFIKPSVLSAAKFINAQTVTSQGLVKFNYVMKVSGGYNLSLVSYGLVSLKNTDKATDVRVFFKYLINSCAPSSAVKLGYAPISNAVKVYANKMIGQIGTK